MSYDAVLFDLDGTLIRGAAQVPHAMDTVRQVRRGGTRVAVVTNNASRTPAEVASQLVDAGYDIGPDEIVTSAQAGAGLLQQMLPRGAEVLVVGTAALVAEVEGVGLRAVREAGPETTAVVQGHSPDTCWRDLAEACLAIRAGAAWVACNRDATFPSEDGELPGNGSMVAALVTATGRTPTVAGKPGRPLIDAAAVRLGSAAPLVAGDRLDTDIAGAIASGHDSMLVLTGVTGPVELLTSAAATRPTFLSPDLRGLLDLEATRVAPRGGWSARFDDGALVLSGEGDPWDALRTLSALVQPRSSRALPLVANGRAAAAALQSLDLPEMLPGSTDTVNPIDPLQEAQR